MKIEEIEKQLETTDSLEYKGKCLDCGKKVKVHIYKDDKEVIIEGGAIYNPEKHTFFKCDKCFEKDRILRNYQPCEVFSRVVGFLTPVQQWNKGKIEEFKQRKEFNLNF